MMLVPGYWFASHHADPRAVALYLRHYSAKRYADGRPRRQFCAPAARMVLLTATADALFVWSYAKPGMRLDGQEGVNCAIFRNEGPVLSSVLVEEACALAWARWPDTRLWTYVDPRKTRHKRDPGRCFRKAGWVPCGWSKGGLLIMERMPA